MSDHVAVGVITRPHGVRGEVRVHPFNADSTLLGELEEVRAQRPDSSEAPRTLRIAKARRAAKHWIVRLEGVDGRDEAEALRGLELLVSRDELPEPAEDEVYLADLEGLEVRHQDRVVGTVAEVLTYPSVVCLAVEGPEGRRELPLVTPWVAELDVEGGWVLCESWDDVPSSDG